MLYQLYMQFITRSVPQKPRTFRGFLRLEREGSELSAPGSEGVPLHHCWIPFRPSSRTLTVSRFILYAVTLFYEVPRTSN
ncbi:hypothetical protein CROQUDRAFT_107823 [Cronartium quercuum f. sp. fusiforme G11]|uniref:Uncharacterized protein n=1 Tax=Cronartium quercuum f. sp. fusiforme G11 TaxID=708437 RepID=A0A9P6TAM6_9BASI|nr:hypothetical protein CROQUDRAFT_107823 [Cronartium quercuum f. sp. fusiforme G11]